MEPTNAELYDIIRKLTERIDVLEGRIVNNKPTPSIGFDKWLDSCVIGKSQVDIIYDTGDVMDAFKQCCIANFETAPIFKCGNKLNVWDGKWTVWNDENTRLLIQEMWRKIVRYDSREPQDKKISNEVHDARTQKIIGMRHKLYDVSRNKSIIVKWLNSQFE